MMVYVEKPNKVHSPNAAKDPKKGHKTAVNTIIGTLERLILRIF